jgi:hypothetical protein
MAYAFNNIIQKKEPAEKAVLEQCWDGLPTHDGTRVVRHAVAEVDAVELQGLLTVEECARLIAGCNKLGFTFWAIAEAEVAADEATRVATRDAEQSRAFRSADTIEVDLPQLSARLWERIQPHVPTVVVFDEEKDPELFERDAAGTWVATGFSPNLLFARYGSGGHFAPHVDGTTIEHFNRRSLYTVLIYLNTVGAGGETMIMTGDQCAVLTKDAATGQMRGNGENVVHVVRPTEGACVVFRYDVLHEGTAVAERRVKYIIRGDVMFERRPALLDGERDREAFFAYQQARVAEAEGRYDEAVKLFRRVRALSPGIADVYQL